MKNPKTFILAHRAYRIVYTTNTEEKARAAKKGMYDTNPAAHNPTAVKKLADGRWAVGIRKGQYLAKGRK